MEYKYSLGLILCLVLAIFLIGCERVVDTNQIVIKDNTFNPIKARILLGDTITWTNLDKVPHKIEFEQDQIEFFESEALTFNQKAEYTPEHIGTFTYHDHLNPDIKGSIIVIEKLNASDILYARIKGEQVSSWDWRFRLCDPNSLLGRWKL